MMGLHHQFCCLDLCPSVWPMVGDMVLAPGGRTRVTRDVILKLHRWQRGADRYERCSHFWHLGEKTVSPKAVIEGVIPTHALFSESGFTL